MSEKKQCPTLIKLDKGLKLLFQSHKIANENMENCVFILLFLPLSTNKMMYDIFRTRIEM